MIPPEPYNEHPGGEKSVCAGENWTVQHVNALMKSEYWESTAIVIAWHDFGVPGRGGNSGWTFGVEIPLTWKATAILNDSRVG